MNLLRSYNNWRRYRDTVNELNQLSTPANLTILAFPARHSVCRTSVQGTLIRFDFAGPESSSHQARFVCASSSHALRYLDRSLLLPNSGLTIMASVAPPPAPDAICFCGIGSLL